MNGDDTSVMELSPAEQRELFDKMNYLYNMLKRFEPMLEKFENAAKANSFMQRRNAMKGKG